MTISNIDIAMQGSIGLVGLVCYLRPQLILPQDKAPDPGKLRLLRKMGILLLAATAIFIVLVIVGG